MTDDRMRVGEKLDGYFRTDLVALPSGGEEDPGSPS